MCSGVIEASELQALLMGLQLSADAGGMLAKDKESHEYLFKVRMRPAAAL